nr:uncharacterized protein LOC112290636 isoform X1 [Physcomitrium patens]|eukprot:XP_024392893.1 uncharacterized protein LOC112290636 isoform X1 [Physcomitrella patens]
MKFIFYPPVLLLTVMGRSSKVVNAAVEAMNEGLPGLEVGVHYDTINLRTDIPENFLSEEDGSKQWRVGILHNVEVGSFSEPSLLIGVVMAFTNSPRYGDTDRKWKGTMFLLIELKHLTVINGKTDCQAAVVQFLRACTAVKSETLPSTQ